MATQHGQSVRSGFDGRRLTSARERLGLTRTDLAHRVNTTYEVVQQWETGECEPRPRRIPAIAAAVGIAVSDLYRTAGAEATAAERRKAAGLTQADVAAALGVTRAAVSQWELGTRDMPKRHRYAFEQLLAEAGANTSLAEAHPVEESADVLSRYRRPGTGFEYQVEKGVEVIWGLTVSGYDDEIDGELDTDRGRLVDVEATMEDLTADYAALNGAYLTRVRGNHGWRDYEWDNGAVHRYEWSYGFSDLRCDTCRSPDCDLYMVHDELWRSSGMNGWVCFRCFEKAIGRLLIPSDFKPNLPCNTDRTYHCQELRERLGLASPFSESTFKMQ